MRKPDAEEWRKEFDSVIKRYKAKVADPTAEGLTLDQAVEAMGTLGIAPGDAMWWLLPKQQTRPR